MVKVHDANGETIAFLGPQMPEELREHLFDHLECGYPGCLKETDTAKEGINNEFGAIHYSWYNRYSTQVSHIFEVRVRVLYSSASARVKTLQRMGIPIFWAKGTPSARTLANGSQGYPKKPTTTRKDMNCSREFGLQCLGGLCHWYVLLFFLITLSFKVLFRSRNNFPKTAKRSKSGSKNSLAITAPRCILSLEWCLTSTTPLGGIGTIRTTRYVWSLPYRNARVGNSFYMSLV